MKKKHYFLLLVIVFLQAPSLFGHSQKASNDSVRIVELQEIVRSTAGNSREINDSALQEIITLCQIHLADSVATQISFFRKSLASSISAVGVNNFLNANYLKATHEMMEAIVLFDSLNDLKGLSKAYTVIGVIKKHLKDYNSAQTNLLKAVEYSMEAKDTNGIALANINLGLVNWELGKFNDALYYYNAALEAYQSVLNNRGIGVALINLGTLKRSLNEPDSAAYYFKKSIEIREQIKDEQGLIFSHHRLGELLFELGKAEDALYHAKLSYQYAIQKGYPRGLRDANELLYKIYKKKQNRTLALKHYEFFIRSKDGILSTENIRKIAQLESQYAYSLEKKEDSLKGAQLLKNYQLELELKESESENKSLFNFFLLTVLSLLLILAYIVFTRYRNANKQQLIISGQKEKVEKAYDQLKKNSSVIQRQAEEKELLLKEIHHRVKNNLQVISSLLDLQSDNISDKAALSAVEDGQSRVKAMALIHQNLYQNQDIASISFEEYANQLVKQLASVYSGEDKVKVELKSKETFFDIDTAIPLGLILNELISNAYKYAFEGETQGKLNIDLQEISKGEYCLSIKDNGKGLPPNFEVGKTKSLGLRLVHRLSRQLYGEVEYVFDEGANFKVSFKDTQQRKLVR